jgi:hypothetical protein
MQKSAVEWSWEGGLCFPKKVMPGLQTEPTSCALPMGAWGVPALRLGAA